MLQGKSVRRKLLSFTNILVLGIIRFPVLRSWNTEWEKYIGKRNLFVIRKRNSDPGVIPHPPGFTTPCLCSIMKKY